MNPLGVVLNDATMKSEWLSHTLWSVYCVDSPRFAVVSPICRDVYLIYGFRIAFFFLLHSRLRWYWTSVSLPQ